MKKIAIINSVYNQGSTGRICFEISRFLKENGFVVKTFYGRNKNDSIDGFYFGSKIDTFFHGIRSRITDKHGLYSKTRTRLLIKMLEDFKPDLIILHNLHGYYLNISLLLSWLKRNQNIKLISVLHDCWNFTGHCAYFSYKKCSKWKTECNKCPAKKEYPKSILFDRSNENFLLKKQLFSELKQMVIVCPSNWLSNIVSQSFLSNRRIITIKNGIDTKVFKKNTSNFRERYGLKNKKLILCIANVFDERKGLKDVLSLGKLCSNDVVIVIVGHIKQRIKLPHNVIHIERTNNVKQLIDIYSSCDVMFNPTYEDNYPTTNLEAICCDLPVVCYKTGGAVESVDKRFLVEQGDVKASSTIINNLFNGTIKYDFSQKNFFSKEIMLNEYLNVIIKLIGDKNEYRGE